MRDPPVLAGICQLTSAVVLLAEADTFLGAVDADAGVAGTCEGSEATESPLALLAITVNV